MAKKRKIRIDLRRNRSKPPREHGWTRDYQTGGENLIDQERPHEERVRTKGDLSRKRTIITEALETADASAIEMPTADLDQCLAGRVIRVQGLYSMVAAGDGREFRCVVRRVLRNLVIDERNIIAAGDRVWFLPTGGTEGVIERVEPRYGVLRRESRGKEQVLVANVDQIVIVASLAQPDLKPHLIDRYLVSAAQGGIAPIVCLNKVDLVDPFDVQVLVGVYSQLGFATVLTSASNGRGIDQLRQLLQDRQTVFSGQSGVGKSSLLNAIQPQLDLVVREVSDTNQKGRHTTTTAELIPLQQGGWVVDTPGIRQFSLWEIFSVELDGYFPEFRPNVAKCGFPGCSHTHEEGCAVKKAVKEHRIAIQRYESYLSLLSGDTD